MCVCERERERERVRLCVSHHRCLVINDNNFSGSIPESFSSLTALTYVPGNILLCSYRNALIVSVLYFLSLVFLFRVNILPRCTGMHMAFSGVDDLFRACRSHYDASMILPGC